MASHRGFEVHFRQHLILHLGRPFSRPRLMAFCFPETASGFPRSMLSPQNPLSQWPVFCMTCYWDRESPRAGLREFLRWNLILSSLAISADCVQPRSTSAVWLSRGAHSPILLSLCHTSDPRNLSEEEPHAHSLPLGFPSAHWPDWRDLADGSCQIGFLQMGFWQIACYCHLL